MKMATDGVVSFSVKTDLVLFSVDVNYTLYTVVILIRTERGCESHNTWIKTAGGYSANETIHSLRQVLANLYYDWYIIPVPII